jgi:hypothetical protein
MNEEVNHTWHVGDLCSCVYGNMGEGIVYRVTHVGIDKWKREELTVKPVLGVLADIAGRRPRTHWSKYMRPLSLIDLANNYSKLGSFIAEEAKKRGADATET